MKLSEHVYWITGNFNGINSNIYAIQTEKGIVLIDAGYSEKQFAAIQSGLHYWGFSLDDVKDVILTHCHFDHVGNGAKLKSMGKRILMGEKDVPVVETGSEEVIEYVFGTPFTPFQVDVALHPGDVLDYGDVKLTILDQEGHTRGAIGMLLESPSEKILFAGDLYKLLNVSPIQEDYDIELAWMDGKDYSGQKYLENLEKIYDLDVQFIACGHGPAYYGKSAEMMHLIYDLTKAELKKRNVQL